MDNNNIIFEIIKNTVGLDDTIKRLNREHNKDFKGAVVINRNSRLPIVQAFGFDLNKGYIFEDAGEECLSDLSDGIVKSIDAYGLLLGMGKLAEEIPLLITNETLRFEYL